MLPGHVHAAGVMHEVLEPEPELQASLEVNQLSHLALQRRLPVGGEAHQLVLVPETREPEEVRERLIEVPQRMGVGDRTVDLQPGPLALAPHRRYEVAHAVERDARRLLEGGAEERARHVGAVVLDTVELGSELLGRNFQRLGQGRANVEDVGRVAQAGAKKAHARRVLEHEQRLAVKVGGGVAADGDVIDLRGLEPCMLEAPAHRLGGETRLMLEAREAFLLNRGDAGSVHEQGGRGVAVVGVQAQHDLWHQFLLLISVTSVISSSRIS